MTIPVEFEHRIRIPLIASPMFIASHQKTYTSTFPK
jgi:hypothetical protein